MVESEIHFYMLLKFAQLCPFSSLRLVKPKLTQMHPNDFKFCMEEIDEYYDIIMHHITLFNLFLKKIWT